MVLFLIIGIVATGLLVERCFAAIPSPGTIVTFNLFYFVPSTLLQVSLTTLLAGTIVLATNYLGGGLFRLPTGILGATIYVVAMDFGEYLFHRAQHRIPALWAMHSFHHSDQAVNITTTFRHFWAEQALKSITIYFFVGLAFKPDAEIIAIYGAVAYLNYFFHMNVPVGFGRGWFLLNSPQYHRVHHSLRSEHHDKNFVALFPIFDILFGTAYRPRFDEYPPTGLQEDAPHSLVEAIIWPLRKVMRRSIP